MNPYIYIICLLFTQGCASTCQELAKKAYVPESVPSQMGIMIEGKTIQADENGGKFLSNYVKSRNQLQAISLECSK
jgi:hypothetical protein